MNLDDYITKAEAQRQLGWHKSGSNTLPLWHALQDAGVVTMHRVGANYVLRRDQFEDIKRHYRPYIRTTQLIELMKRDQISQALQEVAE